jgi:hypothetical protein
MVDLHSVVGLVVILVNGVACLLGLLYLKRRVEPSRPYAHLLALGQTLLLAQAAIGLLLLSSDHRSPDQLHYLYGGLALGAILAPWFYAPSDPRPRLVWFTGASFFAAALGLRAYLTGS